MSAKAPVVGAARAWTEQELGGPCTENESFVAITSSTAIALNGNGDRVGVLFLNVGSFDAYVGVTSSVSNTQGILLPASGGSVAFNVRDDFTLPSRTFYAAGVGSTTLYVLEINRFSLGGEAGAF